MSDSDMLYVWSDPPGASHPSAFIAVVADCKERALSYARNAVRMKTPQESAKYTRLLDADPSVHLTREAVLR